MPRITIDTVDSKGNKIGDRNATLAELKLRAKRGDATGKLAVLDLIDIAGGYDSLTQAQKDKLLKWNIIGEWTDL